MTHSDMLKTLHRRAKHLEQRIAASDKDLSYDKAELAALIMAIALLAKGEG